MASDRIFGLILVVVALGYVFSALHIQTSFMSDPVGPKTFPLVVGVLTMMCGIAIFLKPDPEPDWPNIKTFGWIGLAVIVLIAYALCLKPLGFLLPTAVTASILAWQITPKPGRAILTGIALSICLFVIFRYALGLGLQAGPRGFFG